MMHPLPRRTIRLVLLLLAVPAVLFTGCASAKIVQLSPDRYRATVQNYGGVFDLAEPRFKEQAISQAMDYADGLGKVAIPLSIQEHAYGLFADWVRVEYEFRVVDKSDPQARRGSTNSADAKPEANDELLKLDDLRAKGILTPAEYERARQRLNAR